MIPRSRQHLLERHDLSYDELAYALGLEWRLGDNPAANSFREIYGALEDQDYTERATQLTDSQLQIATDLTDLLNVSVSELRHETGQAPKNIQDARSLIMVAFSLTGLAPKEIREICASIFGELGKDTYKHAKGRVKNLSETHEDFTDIQDILNKAKDQASKD